MAPKPARVGRTTRTLAQRKQDNKGVKDGAVRVGAGGKAVRKYDAKTARWVLVEGAAPRMAPQKKSTGATTKSLSAARAGDTKQKAGREAQAKATAKQAKNPATGKKWYQAGGGGLVGPNSPLAQKSGSSSNKSKNVAAGRRSYYGKGK